MQLVARLFVKNRSFLTFYHFPYLTKRVLPNRRHNFRKYLPWFKTWVISQANHNFLNLLAKIKDPNSVQCKYYLIQNKITTIYL